MKLRILVACEFSGIVRDAFIRKGHEAMSCDLLPTESPGPHYQGDVFDILKEKWDMLIGHPPCTYLSYAAMHVWNNPGRIKKRLDALDFFRRLWEAPIEKICIENPKGCASPTIAKYNQIIQPYYFGDSAFKTTCLWLKNLPNLKHFAHDELFNSHTHTPIPEPVFITKSGGNVHFVESCNGGKERQKNRAKFWPGIAEAMAEQWS